MLRGKLDRQNASPQRIKSRDHVFLRSLPARDRLARMIRRQLTSLIVSLPRLDMLTKLIHSFCQCNYNLSKPTFVPSKHLKANQFNFKTVECSQVAEVVLSMSLNKSLRIDKITTSVIKDSLPASPTNGIFPRAQKMAEILPILKDGDHEEPNNNSPISLQPILFKICKRIGLSQLVLQLNKK